MFMRDPQIIISTSAEGFAEASAVAARRGVHTFLFQTDTKLLYIWDGTTRLIRC